LAGHCALCILAPALSLHSRFERFRQIARAFGWGTVLRLIGLRVLNRVIRFDVLIVLLIDRDRARCPETPDESQLSFKVLRAREYSTVLSALSPELRQKFHLDGFDLEADPDDILLVAYVGSTLAGFGFGHTGGAPKLAPGVRLRAPKGYLYAFASFTPPEFRGRKHHGRRHYELLQTPEGQSCAGLIAYVNYTNLESRRGVAKSGYRPVGHLYHARIRRLNLVWCSRSLKRTEVRLDGGRTWSLSRLDKGRSPEPAGDATAGGS